MIPVNVRLPAKLIEPIDKWVDDGRFASRSDAIKTMIRFYEERERTAQFLQMLDKRGREARRDPDELVPLQDSILQGEKAEAFGILQPEDRRLSSDLRDNRVRKEGHHAYGRA